MSIRAGKCYPILVEINFNNAKGTEHITRVEELHIVGRNELHCSWKQLPPPYTLTRRITPVLCMREIEREREERGYKSSEIVP